MVIWLDGKKLADELTRRITGKFKTTGKLAAVQVGQDPASTLYLKKKKALSEQVGVGFEWHKLPANSSTPKAIKLIDQLNCDRKIAGIIVQLPLPKSIDTSAVVNAVVPNKDVDGLTDANIISGRVLPATAAGILRLLSKYKIDLSGKKIVLVGFTRLLNLPLSLELIRRGNVVIVLQKGTKNFSELKTADVIITATGQPNLIQGRAIKAGVVVVDAGIATKNGKLVGDCEKESVAKRAGYLTPVPGGVGPMTVVSLLMNLLELAKK